MVAQIDEQQSAMVADAVAPAGQPHLLADVACAQRAAGMGAITVHNDELSLDAARKGTCGGALVKNGAKTAIEDLPPPEPASFARGARANSRIKRPHRRRRALDSVPAICTLGRPFEFEHDDARRSSPRARASTRPAMRPRA